VLDGKSNGHLQLEEGGKNKEYLYGMFKFDVQAI
jgi:hypothetical protein